MSDDLTGASSGRITCLDSPVPGAALRDEIGGPLAVLPSSIPGMTSAGELHLAEVHTAIGMRSAAEHLGLTCADVIAFGDGLNDVEMVAEAGIGVAVEGADPRVVAAADRVAAGPDREELVTAFAALGLV